MRIPKVVAGLVALVLVAGAVVGVVVLASDDADEVIDFAGIAAATRAAGVGRYTGEIDGKAAGNGPIDGRYDLDTEQWQVTYPWLTGQKIDVEMRVTGGMYYLKRPIDDPESPSFDRPWVSAEPDARMSQGVVPLDPVTVVEGLVEAGVTVDLAEDAEVGGGDGRHYAITVRSHPDSASALAARAYVRFGTVSSPFPPIVSNSKVELWVDADDRLHRIKIVTGNFTSDVTLEELGGSLDVAAPADRETVPVREAAVTIPAEPSGEFTPVTAGTTNGIAWTLEAAEGTLDTTCYRLDTPEPLPIVGAGVFDAPTCVLPPADDADPEEEFETLTVSTGEGTVDGFAARIPTSTTKVEVGFSGGSKQEVPFDAERHLLVWTGPTDPAIGWVGITVESGEKFDCAPGPVYDLPTLLPLTAGQAHVARQYGWSCIINYD